MKASKSQLITFAISAALSLFIVPGKASPATTPPIPITGCDFLITAPGSYYLANDLNCSASPGVLIAASKVDLDLAGHTITSEAESVVTAITDPVSAGFGVCTAVTSVRIHSGTVSPGLAETAAGFLICSPNRLPATMGVQIDHIIFNNFDDFVSPPAIDLEGTNKSVVIKNSYFNNSTLFALNSSGTQISGNLLVGSGSHVIISGGGSNALTGNVLHGSGSGQSVTQSAVLIISSVNNLVQGNYADTGVDGIVVGGSSTGNTITGNTAFGNSSFDFEDASDTTCTLNSWSNNFFGTSSPGCIR